MLEANHATPLYQQLQNSLRNDLLNGVYAAGDRMPSEAELEQAYGVSRITVRRAIAELEKQGLLERKQGKGTFVCHHKAEWNMNSIGGFTESLSGEGHRVSRVIHGKQIIAAEDWMAEALAIPPGAKVIELKRTLYSDQEAILYDECYYPLSRFPGLLEKLDEQTSTYYLIENVYGIAQPRAHKRFNVEVADVLTSRYLECAVGELLFSIFKLTYDGQDQPVHISKTRVMARRVTYVLDIDERQPTGDVQLLLQKNQPNR